MAAVGLAVAIERSDEQRHPVQRGEHAPGARALEHGVADQGRQVLEHRRAPEEDQLVGRQLREELGAEVLGQEPVVAAGDRVVPVAGRERAEADPCGPALTPLEQIAGVVGREPCVEPAKERLALATAQCQLAGLQLQQPPVRPQPRDRQRGRVSADQRQR